MEQAILYFDHTCTLCNKSIAFLIKRDKKKHIKLNSLHSINQKGNYESVILSYNGTLYEHSTAIIKSIILLGGFYRFAYILLIIPKKIRDAIYKSIANNRYIWFGLGIAFTSGSVMLAGQIN